MRHVRLDQSNVVRSDAHPLVGYDDVVALAPDLLAAARYLLKDDAEARDLVQTTLEIGIRKIDQLRDPSRLRPWLFAIETREAFRLRRRLTRYLAARPSVGTLASSDHHEDTFVVRDAVSRLPVRMQGAVVLHHLVGLTVSETAAAMGITQNTAMK